MEGCGRAARGDPRACRDKEGKPLDPQRSGARRQGAGRAAQVVQDGGRDHGAAARARDVGVLAYVTQIIPATILDAPRLASVCFHPSLLPKYRGGSAINWQIINGATTGGVTLFRPDDGIDEGPIYLQKEIPIGPDETAGSFYYSAVFEPGVAATIESVEMLLAGTARGGANESQVRAAASRRARVD
jgi:methionyl-tRNA formyltransferase